MGGSLGKTAPLSNTPRLSCPWPSPPLPFKTMNRIGHISLQSPVASDVCTCKRHSRRRLPPTGKTLSEEALLAKAILLLRQWSAH